MRSWIGGLTTLLLVLLESSNPAAQTGDDDAWSADHNRGRGAGLAWGHGTLDLDAAERADLAHENRIALVIGNGGYGPTMGRVANPVRDAADIADVLRDLGFSVSLELNLDRAAMMRALHVFSSSLEDDGVGLFYYAGHVIQAQGRNFMVPVDAELDELRTPNAGTAGRLAGETVELAELLDRLQHAPTRANVVILEAGFESFLVRSSDALSPGLARIGAPPRTLVAYATAPGQTVLADSHGGQGYYAQALLELLPAPGLPVETLFKRVRERVAALTSGYQTPWETSSLVGEFSFRPVPEDDRQQALPTRGPDPSAAPWARTPGLPDDVLAWDAIRGGDRPEQMEAFLEQFPNSIFASFASKRLGEPEPEVRGGAPIEFPDLVGESGSTPDAAPRRSSLRLRPGQSADALSADALSAAEPAPSDDAAGDGWSNDEWSMAAAMDLIRGAEYDEAIRVLSSFLRDYPASAETSEAAYLLAESLYLAGDFEGAAAMFAWNYGSFRSDVPRAPDNLLKLGMSLDALGETAAACLTYLELDERFPMPPSHVSRTLARERAQPACV